MKSIKKRIISIIVLIILIAATCAAVYLKSVRDYQQSVKDLTFTKVDLSGATNSSSVLKKAVENALVMQETA